MHPFERSELRGRVLPFTVPFVLAGLLVVARVLDVTTVRALSAAGLLVAALGVIVAAPWRRLPRAVQIVPSLLTLAAIATGIAGDDTTGTSPLVVLLIAPVLWLALYHDPPQVWIGVAGAGCAVAAGAALAGEDTKISIADALLTIAAMSVLAATTIRLLAAERRAAAATAAERDRHRQVLGRLPDTVIGILDRDLTIVSADGALSPQDRAAVIGRPYDEIVLPGSGRELRDAFIAALRGEETRLEHRSARSGRAYDVQVLPLRQGCAITGVAAVARNVTEERAAAARLAASERDHRLLTESARDMISRHDAAGAFLYVSAACRELLGYAPDELLGRPIHDFVEPADHAVMDRALRRMGALSHASVELRMRRQDGTVVWVELRLRRVGDEIHSTARDVTGRRDAERELAHLAAHDDLTGLWNRRRFNEALREELARAHRRGPDAVMLLIDLDDFKGVNDTYGHPTGDRLLVATARAIRSRMREGDAAGRLGGDEFAVLLRGTAPDQAEQVADVYGRAIEAEAIHLDDGGILHPSASVGWTVVAGEILDERSVLAGADVAMYRQKALRRESA